MKIKPAIVSMMKDTLPEFALTYSKGIFYVFKKAQENEPFQGIKFQRDGETGALSLELAVTYNPDWRGEPAKPLGLSVSIADLRFGSGRAFDGEKDWYVYGASPELFHSKITLIQQHLLQYGVPFLVQARQQLLSDPVLQLALTTRRAMHVTDDDLEQLETDVKGAGYLLANLTNARYVQFRDFLLAHARRSNLSEDQLGYVPRLACELLLMKTV